MGYYIELMVTFYNFRNKIYRNNQMQIVELNFEFGK